MILRRSDRYETERTLIRLEAKEARYIVIVEGPDHCRCQTESNGLKYQALCCVSRFQVNVTMPAAAVFHGRALKDCSNAEACRRGCDPILTDCRRDKRLTIKSGRFQPQLMTAHNIAVDADRERSDALSTDVKLQRIERTR